MTTRRRIASASEIPEGTGIEIRVGMIPVAVWHVGGRFYATSARCPHQDGPLCSGTLDGNVVMCPMHDWQFDVTTGRGVNPPDRRLARYDVVVEGDDVYLVE